MGSIPARVISAAIGMHTALGAAVGTTFLSTGNLLLFGGLLVTLPSEEEFAAFRQSCIESDHCDYTFYSPRDPYVKEHPEYVDELGFIRNR